MDTMIKAHEKHVSFLIELYLDNKLLQEYNICGDKNGKL